VLLPFELDLVHIQEGVGVWKQEHMQKIEPLHRIVRLLRVPLTADIVARLGPKIKNKLNLYLLSF
jgi:hypothetical protein